MAVSLQVNEIGHLNKVEQQHPSSSEWVGGWGLQECLFFLSSISKRGAHNVSGLALTYCLSFFTALSSIPCAAGKLLHRIDGRVVDRHLLVHHFRVNVQMLLPLKCLRAPEAGIGPQAGVIHHVARQLPLLSIGLATGLASKRTFACVGTDVDDQLLFVVEAFRAVLAREWLVRRRR